jgi:hypothetical protein
MSDWDEDTRFLPHLHTLDEGDLLPIYQDTGLLDPTGKSIVKVRSRREIGFLAGEPEESYEAL